MATKKTEAEKDSTKNATAKKNKAKKIKIQRNKMFGLRYDISTLIRSNIINIEIS